MNSNALVSSTFNPLGSMRAFRSWKSASADETIGYGREIGQMLRPGSTVALVGELGSGKTTLVKGLALGLGVRDSREVKSPTFVIFHIYNGRIPLYHFDLYRLEGKGDFEGIGLDEFLSDPKAISVIEWADRAPKLLSDSDVRIELSRLSESRRQIKVYRSGSSK